MADEAPLKLVAKKRKLKTKIDVVLMCIIHCCNIKVTLITDTTFSKIKEACNIQKKPGSDFETYGHIIKIFLMNNCTMCMDITDYVIRSSQMFPNCLVEELCEIYSQCGVQKFRVRNSIVNHLPMKEMCILSCTFLGFGT